MDVKVCFPMSFVMSAFTLNGFCSKTHEPRELKHAQKLKEPNRIAVFFIYQLSDVQKTGERSISETGPMIEVSSF
jgi:hypothetical protein